MICTVTWSREYLAGWFWQNIYDLSRHDLPDPPPSALLIGRCGLGTRIAHALHCARSISALTKAEPTARLYTLPERYIATLP